MIGTGEYVFEEWMSNIGLGTQPPETCWGLMIALIVLGFNLFGDALRDTLDPRLKN